MLDAPLATADRSALLDAVAWVGSARTLDDFARRACERLLTLVPGISASYNELDLLAGRAASAIWPDPGEQWFATWGPVFAAHMQQNPLVGAFEATGEHRLLTWLDVDPDRSFEHSALYREFYAPLGIRSQVAFLLPAPPGMVIGFAINRDGTDVTARERRLLTELAVHLVNVHRLVAQAERGAASAAVLAAHGWTVLLVSAAGEVVGSNQDAVTVGEGAGLDLRVGARLAGTALWQRLTADEPGPVFSVGRAPDPVVVHGAPGFEALLHRTPAGPHVVWLREPSRVTPDLARRTGLTPRQAEVAALLVSGATNQQIASALRIAPGTVRKHLESVYAVLGVPSRAAAAAALMSLARAG